MKQRFKIKNKSPGFKLKDVYKKGNYVQAEDGTINKKYFVIPFHVNCKHYKVKNSYYSHGLPIIHLIDL